MNDENIQEKPKNMELIIVEYIYNNPMIKHRDLKRELTKNNKKMTAKTLNTYLYGDKRYPIGLIDKKHILAHGERTYNRKKYDDIFEFNKEKIKDYPDLMQKTHMKITKEIDLLASNLLKNQVDKFAHIIDMLMQFGIDIELVQKPSAKKIYLSDFVSNRFSQILKLMIYECFLNNPDAWYVFFSDKDFLPFEPFEDDKKKGDLDFSINIKLKFSEIPHFYERLRVLIQYKLLTRDLYDNLSTRKYHSLTKEKKKNRRLEHINFKSFYANAKYETEERERKESCGINDKKEFQKRVERLEDEIFEKACDSDEEIRDLWFDLGVKKSEIEKELGAYKDLNYLIQNKDNLYFKDGKWLKKKG